MARSKGEGSIYYIEKRKKWTSPYSNWGQTLSQFKISFDDRIQLEI